MFIFDQLSWFLRDSIFLSLCPSSISTHNYLFSLGRQCLCGNSAFLDLDSSIVSNIVKSTLRTEILDCTVCINLAIEHTDEIMSPRKNELDMIRDKNLQQSQIRLRIKTGKWNIPLYDWQVMAPGIDARSGIVMYDYPKFWGKRFH